MMSCAQRPTPNSRRAKYENKNVETETQWRGPQPLYTVFKREIVLIDGN